MCTSFVFRGDNVLVGMNFDNNGMKFRLSDKEIDKFYVSVKFEGREVPSFGVNKRGIFVNQLMVDSNGLGEYKRAGKKVTHTTKLVADLLYEKIEFDILEAYLAQKEVVNVPGVSSHNMLVNKLGEVWVTEPGRGNIHQLRDETPFFVMSNCSVCDIVRSNKVEGSGADRYEKALQQLMKGNKDFSVKEAFEVLNEVKQTQGDWITEFSMVYSANEDAVYYCYNHDFEDIKKHKFI